MLKVYVKEYSTSRSADVNSFAKALKLLAEEINQSGLKYTVVHTENEKVYKTKATANKDLPYREQIGGRAVVLVQA